MSEFAKEHAAEILERSYKALKSLINSSARNDMLSFLYLLTQYNNKTISDDDLKELKGFDEGLLTALEIIRTATFELMDDYGEDTVFNTEEEIDTFICGENFYGA